jgi:GNAT superfamily N-acetyltransferase
MIRRAVESDIDACVEMGRKFHSVTGVDEIEYSAESAKDTLTHLLSGDGCLFVADKSGAIVGMAAALKYPHYMNRAQSVAQELFWWVEPEHRGGMTAMRLLMALEQWATDEGCKMLTMICLPIDSPAENIYRRFGYRALEKSFVKELM